MAQIIASVERLSVDLKALFSGISVKEENEYMTGFVDNDRTEVILYARLIPGACWTECVVSRGHPFSFWLCARKHQIREGRNQAHVGARSRL